MFRLLLLCIAFFLLYIGFAYISSYDTYVDFAFGNYHVETTLFTFSIAILFCLIIVLSGLKLLFLLLDLPQIIKNKAYRNRLQRLNHKALKAVADLLMGNKAEALDLAGRVVLDNQEENADILHLIKAEKSSSFDQKIKHLRILSEKKSYNKYAIKKLAELFYENSHYAEAEEYAVMSFNKDDTDTETMLLLVRIYAKKSSWDKMVFVVSKIQRADSALLESVSEEFAKYYYMAAKNALAAEQDEEAAKFLESALKLKLDYLEALILYTEIKIGMKQTAEILRVLRSAYSYKPTFAIAELFIECSRSSSEAMYNTLASIVEPKNHPGLYLALAAYLDLPERIEELRKISVKTTNDSGH